MYIHPTKAHHYNELSHSTKLFTCCNFAITKKDVHTYVDTPYNHLLRHTLYIPKLKIYHLERNTSSRLLFKYRGLSSISSNEAYRFGNYINIKLNSTTFGAYPNVNIV